MNLFEAVKDTIPTRAAAEYYGLEVKRNGMVCCPFHDDKNPSMKVDTRFYTNINKIQTFIRKD